MSKSKIPAKKASKSNGSSNGSNGHAKAAVRSAKLGGKVPAERYAKDPESVVKRLHEKAEQAGTQAANALVRAKAAGDKSRYVTKLEKSIGAFESAMKVLSS